jgi:lipoprotein NlpI
VSLLFSAPVRRLAPLLFLAAALLAYANTWRVPFVFDDIAAVTQNPSLAQWTTALRPPGGLSVTGRPLANLSLALNHAISGQDPWSYHALNLALHLANAALLYAILVALLASPGGPRSEAPLAAAFTTLLWLLHPLQTAAVTYVMQRTELLASFCVLLTLHAFLRRRFALAVAACACGLAAKENAVVTPWLVLLLDWATGGRSLRATLAAQKTFYAALAATWGVQLALLLGTESRGASAGFAAGLAWGDYASTQLAALARYLRLCLWPEPLVFDYGRELVHDAGVAVGVAILTVALGVLAVGVRRNRVVAFCLLSGGLLLAPTSLVPIATQTIAEHRVYLACAVPLALLVTAIVRVLGRPAAPVLLGSAVALAATTFARNRDYASVTALWRDTALKQPGNARAHYNHGLALLASGATAPAARAFAAALALEPRHAPAHVKLGTLLLGEGRAAEAREHFVAAVEAEPSLADAHYGHAIALLMLGRTAEAIAPLQATVRLAPAHAAAHYNFGNALVALERYAEALVHFETAARLDPQNDSARRNAAAVRAYLEGK